MRHAVVVLKYALIGLLCGALLGALVAIVWAGPSTFFSHESTWFGMQSAWARVILYYCLELGSASGVVIGFIVGTIRALISFFQRA